MIKILLSIFLLISGCVSNMPQAFATVPQNVTKVIYNGDGTSSSFVFGTGGYSIPVYLNTDIQVFTQNVSTGAVTQLTLNSQYTVTLTAVPYSLSNTVIYYTAVVNLLGGSSPYGALPIGTNLILNRSIPFTNLINITDYSGTPAATWNQGYDRATMLSQQLMTSINQAVLQPISATSSITLPSPVLGEYLVWGPGNTLINSTGSGAQGPAGQGVPTGGTTGQVLQKNSSTNYDTSWTTISLGTVSSVTSANSDISVSNSTTTPVLTLNSGTSPNQIVKLNSSGKLPGVDGSLLTNISSTANWVPNNIQVFTSSGTWTKPTNVSSVYVKVVGGGGAGGNGQTSGNQGGGGGGGGYAEGVIAVTGNVTVTIGSTNSFAGTTTISAPQGTAGVNGVSGGAGGAGGAAGTGGTIAMPGGAGAANIASNIGGIGGPSVLGTPTPGNIGNAGVVGNPYGSGGSGGDGNGHFGGTGDPGAVIVYY